VLREDGTLIPSTHFNLARESGDHAAAKSKDYVRRHWKYYEPPRLVTLQNNSLSSMEIFLDRIKSYSLCISGMAFQDAWNIDLERLQRCCIHIIADEKKLVPFCAYYLTDARGRRIVDRVGGNAFK
jgi:uncharacterized radical SAM superfamily Fe-S cluster-containing enzyme